MADDVTIFHNPSCSKSRQALGLLQDGGVEPAIVLYKQAPPDRATVERIVRGVDVEPSKLVRRDPEFKESGLTPRRRRDRGPGHRGPPRPPRPHGAAGGREG